MQLSVSVSSLSPTDLIHGIKIRNYFKDEHILTSYLDAFTFSKDYIWWLEKSNQVTESAVCNRRQLK